VLAAEHRQERLILRLALAGPAGAAMAAVAGWPAGLAVAAAVGFGHVWYVRWQPGALAGWRSGALAERRTGRVLGRLDQESFQVLHDRALPDAPAANLDHLVIGMTGIYAITTRRWTGRPLRLRADRRRLWLGERQLHTLPSAAARAGGTVAAALTAELDHEIGVTSLVAVHGARLPAAGLRFGGVVFHPVRQVPGFIRRNPVVFTSAQVATIAAAAERLLPPMLERHR
jgi:hypothetical protein